MIFKGTFPCEFPGVSLLLLDFAFPVFCILLGETKTFHILSDAMYFSSVPY